jgi:predicted permease
VSGAYFRALDIPLVRGRLFDDRDGEATPHVAVISESLVRSRWRDADPIGATIEFGKMDGDRRPITIVGIVGDTREYGLERPPRPTVYVNQMQRPSFTATIVMRSDADAGAIVSAARTLIKNAAPDVAPRFRAFEEIYAASLGARRFNLTLVAVFAGTALILAITGIYGVMAYTVTQRRREIGVRIALGGTSGQLLRKILGEGLTMTAIGMSAGVAGALGLTRTMESLLFGVKPTDSATFAIVIVTLALVAAAACFLPARRAISADPAAVLRQD